MELRNKLQDLLISIFFLVLFTSNKCVLSCHSQIASHTMEENKDLKCGDDQLYHKETDRCYRFNSMDQYSSIGPCGNLMFFRKLKENSERGRCECFILPPEVTRSLLYDKRTKQCYFILSQGPCKDNMHIGVVNDRPKCVHNPCANEQKQAKSRRNSSQEDFVVYNRVCTQLGSQCGTNGIINVVRKSTNITCEERLPETTTKKMNLKAIGAIGASSCPDGQYSNVAGRCQEPVELDF